LSGLIFFVFGLNGFLHFIPQPPPSNPLAVQFFVAASASHYMAVVFLAQIIGGVLLLAGRFVQGDGHQRFERTDATDALLELNFHISHVA
jgi:Na+-driven multidrug efflux pump